jgi:hypothetical protein
MLRRVDGGAIRTAPLRQGACFINHHQSNLKGFDSRSQSR